MAVLHVTEYSDFGVVTGRGLDLAIAVEPAVADQAVTFTTSTASAAFNAATKFVRLLSTIDCHVVFGAAPTATAAKQKIVAGTEYWRSVVPGQKVAAYDGSS